MIAANRYKEDPTSFTDLNDCQIVPNEQVTSDPDTIIKLLVDNASNFLGLVYAPHFMWNIQIRGYINTANEMGRESEVRKKHRILLSYLKTLENEEQGNINFFGVDLKTVHVALTYARRQGFDTAAQNIQDMVDGKENPKSEASLKAMLDRIRGAETG